MVKATSILSLFFCSIFAAAQSGTAKTSIYLELLGNSGVYSLNVERTLTSNLNGRIGFGAWSTEEFWSEGERTLVTFPVMGNMLFGEGSNKFEIGAGFLLGWSRFQSGSGEENDSTKAIFNLTGVVGYRYQKPQGGFVGRLGLTPFLALTSGEDSYPDPGFFLSGGVSLGYAF